jgi:hypothetical protein
MEGTCPDCGHDWLLHDGPTYPCRGGYLCTCMRPNPVTETPAKENPDEQRPGALPDLRPPVV